MPSLRTAALHIAQELPPRDHTRRDILAAIQREVRVGRAPAMFRSVSVPIGDKEVKDAILGLAEDGAMMGFTRNAISFLGDVAAKIKGNLLWLTSPQWHWIVQLLEQVGMTKPATFIRLRLDRWMKKKVAELAKVREAIDTLLSRDISITGLRPKDSLILVEMRDSLRKLNLGKINKKVLAWVANLLHANGFREEGRTLMPWGDLQVGGPSGGGILRERYAATLSSVVLHAASELPSGDPLRRKLLASLKESREDPADKAMLMVSQGERFIHQHVTEKAEDLETAFKEAARHAETLERKFSGQGWRSASAALQGPILRAVQDLEREIVSIRGEVESTVNRLPRVASSKVAGDAVLIPVSGSAKAVVPANGTDFTLREVQKLVGGYVEVVPMPERGRIMLVDEEGLMKGLPVNRGASRSARRTIVGPALVMDSSMFR